MRIVIKRVPFIHPLWIHHSRCCAPIIEAIPFVFFFFFVRNIPLCLWYDCKRGGGSKRVLKLKSQNSYSSVTIYLCYCCTHFV